MDHLILTQHLDLGPELLILAYLELCPSEFIDHKTKVVLFPLSLSDGPFQLINLTEQVLTFLS